VLPLALVFVVAHSCGASYDQLGGCCGWCSSHRAFLVVFFCFSCCGRPQEFEDVMDQVSSILEGTGDEHDLMRMQHQVADWVKKALIANHVPDENRSKVNVVFQEVYKVRRGLRTQ